MSSGVETPNSTTLDDLVEDAIGGLWGSAPESAEVDETDVLVVRGADFRLWNTRRVLDAAHRRVPTRFLDRRRLVPGDLVLEVSGGSPAQPVGRVIVIDDKAIADAKLPLICSNFCRKLRLRPGINPYFVKRQLDWMYRSGHTDRFQTSTTNIRNLQVEAFLVGTRIELMSSDDQLHLVALLDQLEQSIEGTGTHLATGIRAIQRSRQAILAAACSGRLTADWRETHLPAADPAETRSSIPTKRNRRKVVAPSSWQYGEIPNSWVTLSLDEVTEFVTSGSRGWAKYYSEAGPLFIRAQNINTDWLDISDCAHVVPPSGSEGTRTRVQTNDLLVTITGANVTKSAYVDRNIGEAYVNQHVALARPLVEEMAGFLHLWLISPSHGRAKLLEDAYGAGKPGLNLDNLRSIPIGLPPLDEQLEIVRRTTELLALADTIETKVTDAASRLERSSQAVLAKAFQGDLATEDPS